MAQYRYISSAPAQIMDTPFAFQRYGQLVEMPEELFEQVKERIALIPAAAFDALGHTPEELKKYGRPSREGMVFAGHDQLDPEFERRRNAAFAEWEAIKAPKTEDK